MTLGLCGVGVGGSICFYSLTFKSYCSFERVPLRGEPALICISVKRKRPKV